MRQVLACIVILSLITACGIKRNLELPCQVKRHKTDDTSTPANGQSGSAPANGQPDSTPDNNKPCPKTPTDTSGQPLPTSTTSDTVQKQ